MLASVCQTPDSISDKPLSIFIKAAKLPIPPPCGIMH